MDYRIIVQDYPLSQSWLDFLRLIRTVEDMKDFEENTDADLNNLYQLMYDQLSDEKNNLNKRLNICFLNIQQKSLGAKKISGFVNEFEIKMFRENFEVHNNELKNVNNLISEFHMYLKVIKDLIKTKKASLNMCLSTERFNEFERFTADLMNVGVLQCSICLAFVDVGTKMVRLNCDGRHSFCVECVEKWLDDNITCPNCRHRFT